MLSAEQLFERAATDAVAIPIATAFARVALRSRHERLAVVYVQAILLACLAAANARQTSGAIYWHDMAITSACEVLSLLAPQHVLGAVVASVATGASIASGRSGLALRAFCALALAYAVAPPTSTVDADTTAEVKKMKVSELRAALEAAGADASGLKADLVERVVANQQPPQAFMVTRFLITLLTCVGAFVAAPRIARYLLPVAELERAYKAFAAVGGRGFREQTVALAFVGLRVQLGVGQLGVDYLRASQRRKNLLVGAGGQKPLGARLYGRKVLVFVASAAIPYIVQRTALEATYELSFKRYTASLTRSLRLDSVLGGDARALTAVAASDLTLEAHAATLETSARRCYELCSRKIFSVPKLLLLPTMIASQPRAFLAALPVFLALDGAKARGIAALTQAVERRRKAAKTLASIRSKVEAKDVQDADALRAANGEAFVKARWATLASAIEKEKAFGTFYETVRRYVRWLYWSDFLTPALEVGLAGLLERDLIDVGDVWVTARALEDGLDTLLTRSRAEAELGELTADVERLETFSQALSDARGSKDASLGRTCRSLLPGGPAGLKLDVAFTRGAARVNAKALAKPGDILAVSGPNGGGKSSLFALLQACARGDAAPPPGLVLEKEGVVAVPNTLVHVAQQPYCPLHATPIEWAATRVQGTDVLDDVASLLDGLDMYPGSFTNKTALSEEQDDFCGSLSGGQRVKFELVRQVFLPHKRGVVCPELLLLDEIFSPLDPASKATAQKALKDACSASVVLAIFHAEVGACVPSFDFFTGVLHFERGADDVTGVARVGTCS